MAFLYYRNVSLIALNSVKNRIVTPQIRLISCCTKNHAKSTTVENEEDPDKPIEYLKSDAAKLKAQQIRSGTSSETAPWFQPYVISGSLAVFMIYFFLLREESDIDLEFNKNLYDRISGLEEKNLEIVLQYNKENQLPTADIEQRLEELHNKK